MTAPSPESLALPEPDFLICTEPRRVSQMRPAYETLKQTADHARKHAGENEFEMAWRIDSINKAIGAARRAERLRVIEVCRAAVIDAGWKHGNRKAPDIAEYCANALTDLKEKPHV